LDNSYGREMQYDVEKLMHFENGTCMVLLKNNMVPQGWMLLWTEDDGGFGKRKGHSELVFRCTYREICQRLAAPEDAKLAAEVEAELLKDKNIDADRIVSLLKRRTRLKAMDDKRMDDLEAQGEAQLARIQGLPLVEQEGFVRDALSAYQREKAEDDE
jgi:hypothetical protein